MAGPLGTWYFQKVNFFKKLFAAEETGEIQKGDEKNIYVQTSTQDSPNGYLYLSLSWSLSAKSLG